MRQGEDDDVVPGQRIHGRGLEHPVGELDDVRMVLTQSASGVAVRGQGPDLELGMVEGRRSTSPPAYPLAPATATLRPMLHEYAGFSMLMQSPVVAATRVAGMSPASER